MKTFTKTMAMMAMMAFSLTNAHAQQYITEAPAGGFDFNNGSDYVVLYAPAPQVTAIGSKMLSNQNLDPTMTDNQFFYWTADWNDKLFVLWKLDDDKPNSWGEAEKQNMTPLFDWGAGDFTAKAKPYDLSKVTDDHILHIGFMNIGAASATAYFKFALGPTELNGFQLVVNQAIGADKGGYVGVGAAPDPNKWYYLDIPLKDLIDEDGDFGFEYDFSQPIDGKIFTCGFMDAVCSTYDSEKAEIIDPDTGMATIEVTSVGSAMAIDGVFLYKKDSSDGIQNLTLTLSEGEEAVYNLAGQKVGESFKGVVIKNGKRFIQK